ncbi:unnamed protein product [Musa acuminata subsp. malaccensis]|uniref:(wild Malaysian banana) hypothetical protein n=1 Tax=Musa acuminata subsp. malaccensis TaxID=214687 RepID=A0A804IAN1_MUSAM|nr:PREDICTED: uncharacterized protein LOC103977876 [Musa acuminata subsp. malaccensis]XP_009391800.1 PREDICTED: uncharacterized protein LOC103977876 [Musa acuminata subsp. malaccensis]XP_018679267.1 PREDICTED: uncharacterized protein LOC103977876 [Musa acuminata subsp. malaccensis]CAG1849777.1 unnamed protein product [Musa acuminata subsp. malaccensis]
MLSIDNPSDPSCSSNLSALNSHEGASEKLDSQEAKTVVLQDNPTSNFSIRDYVLASRNKGIESSWPFPQQFLQLCVKHGSKPILPPFEPPHLVRTQCVSKPAEPQPVACSEPDSILADDVLLEPLCVSPFGRKPASVRSKLHLPLKEIIPNSSDPAVSSEVGNTTVNERTKLDELIHLDAKNTLTVRTHHPTEETTNRISEDTVLVAESGSASEIPSELCAPEPSQNSDKLCKPLEKKCRLKIKLGAISKTSQLDNIASYIKVSDPMASKVCPVCKIFSSTSNTTLNAHMDQCLFVESNTKNILGELPKFKVKQRKKRLMVDIYTTAPCCTLEDLDRRNGTNWAVELALLAAPTTDVGNGTKRAKLSTMESIDDGNESAVYVDSSGMKVRILSKFHDAPLENNLKLRKHARDVKALKSVLNGKKKNFKSKYSKSMEVKTQKSKMSFKFIATPEGDHRSADQQHSETQTYKSYSENQVKNTAATSRQWVHTIQPDLEKGLINKGRNISLERTVSVNRTILAENSQSDPCNSSAVDCHQNNFSRSSEVDTGSPKMKRIDCLYNDFDRMNDVKVKSSEPLASSSRHSSKGTKALLKLSKSVDNCQSLKTKSVEDDSSVQTKYNKFSNLAMRPLECSPSMLNEATVTSKKNILVKRSYFHLEGRRGEAIQRPSMFLKFRKHRSILRTGKRGPSYLPPMNGVHGPTRSFGLNITRKNRTLCTRQSGLSSKFIRSESKVMNQGSPSQSNIPEYEKQESPDTLEEQKHNRLNVLALRPGCHDPQIEDSDMQIEVPDSEAAEKVVADDFVNADSLTFSTQSYSCPCADDVQSISGNEVHVVQHFKQRSDQQETVCDDVSCNEIDHQDIQIVEAADRGVEDSCAVQPTDCQAEITSVQDSSGCLSTHRDVELEVPRKSPSVTSFVVTADHDLSGDSGPSGSPLSTGSTISLTSSEDSRLKDSAEEPSLRAIAVQDRLCLASQTAGSIRAAEQRMSSGRNEELKEDLPSKVPGVGQPFCCSCWESISKDSQLSRQNGTSRKSKASQISNLFIGPSISSSFGTYPNWRTVLPANPGLESSDLSISMNNSLDSAAKYPTCIDLGSPSPSPQSQNKSTSNPVLRLMGKNLTVVTSEQLVQPQITALDFTPNMNSVSPGFSSTNNLLKKEGSAQHYDQLWFGSPAIGQALSTGDHQMLPHLSIVEMGGIARSPFYSWTTKTDQQTWQAKPTERPNFSQALMDASIVTDDPHFGQENELKGLVAGTANSLLLASGPSPSLQRSFSYFSSESQTRNISGGPGSLFPNCLHQKDDASLLNQRINSEGQGHLLLGPSIFQSPTSGQMAPTMYYPPLLR